MQTQQPLPEPGTLVQILNLLSTTSGPVGLAVAFASLVIASGSAIRLVRSERRSVHTKIGLKNIGVNRRAGRDGQTTHYYQVRLVAAEGFVVTDAGLSYRRWGFWRDARQVATRFAPDDEAQTPRYLPQVVLPGAIELLIIEADSPSSGFWLKRWDRNKPIRYWITIGNNWPVRTAELRPAQYSSRPGSSEMSRAPT